MEVKDFVDELLKMQNGVSNANHTADMATSQIATHEAVCAERYGNLQRLIGDMVKTSQNFNTELGKIRILVYIGVGIWVGIPVVSGFFYGLWEVVQKVSGHAGP